ncbi:MAG: peptidoglycan DD-metalloendopeptidase family protein [Pseudomonadota bacterium]
MFAKAKKPRGATRTRDTSPGKFAIPVPGNNGFIMMIIAACLIVFVTLLNNDHDEGIASVTELDASKINDPTSDSAPRVPPNTLSGEINFSRTEHLEAKTTLRANQPWIEQVVKRGDNLSLIFQRAGFTKRDVHDVVHESQHGKALARIFPGEIIAFQSDADGDLAAVRVIKSPLETITYRDGEGGFMSEVAYREPEARQSWATAEITSSLFLAGKEAGLSYQTIMELAGIFGGVIDFVLDPRVGDKIHLVYEELYLDGKKYADGKIVAASFTNRGETFNAYRYTDAQGDSNYFNEDGVSMRKAFLLAPVDFTRISSNFNLRRLHPIYKTMRPHRGTDYAAPTGTPVYAAGDGRVIKAGYTSANGNYVFIAHGDRYVTRYLHLHKRNVKAGQRVSQSQVIGTVGSTGAATGPHLHYEFLMDGVHRDPRKVHKSLPKAKQLANSEMPSFRAAINERSLQLASLRADNQLALNEPTDAPSD